MTPSRLAERAAEVVLESGASVSQEAAQAIGGWIGLVATWNQRIDLTAARSEDELLDLMLADALLLASRAPRGARVVDVGTGAGAPGLPLALARSDLAVTLVEPLQKRVALLRTAVGSLGLGLALPKVVRARGEELAARGERFDVAVSRATLSPPAWLELGARLAPAGEVWVLLAREEPPERQGWKVAEDVRYRWPLTGKERRAARFVAITPPLAPSA
jgi:16S rRNA (guanine527-N7)-methyltransferase